MTQESKDLLLKDLCARLPYGVKCKSQYVQDVIIGGEILIDINIFGRVNIGGHIKDICDIKPYLRPMSSMTEEEETEYKLFCALSLFGMDESDAITFVDWLNKNHFDYRGLIEKGLALDATNLNIY